MTLEGVATVGHAVESMVLVHPGARKKARERVPGLGGGTVGPLLVGLSHHGQGPPIQEGPRHAGSLDLDVAGNVHVNL